MLRILNRPHLISNPKVNLNSKPPQQAFVLSGLALIIAHCLSHLLTFTAGATRHQRGLLGRVIRHPLHQVPAQRQGPSSGRRARRLLPGGKDMLDLIVTPQCLHPAARTKSAPLP